jgi:signal transduction histidine kinase
MRLRLDGLRLQLLGLIILPFSLVLLAVALAGVQIHQQAMRRLVAERDERAVRSAGAALAEQLLHHQAAVAAMALRLGDGTSPELVLSQAADLQATFNRGIAVFDARGRILASTIPADTWAGRPVREVLDTSAGSAHFSPALMESGAPIAMIAAGTGQATVVGAFTTRMLLTDSYLIAAGTNAQQGAFLVDGAGLLLDWQGNLAPPTAPLEHPGVREALSGKSGSSYYRVGADEHVVAFSPVQPTGWALVTEEPWESVTSPVLNNSLLAPLVLIPALLLALMGLWFGARQVVQPLRQLDQEAALLAEDGPPGSGRPVGGIAEIRDLQRTLNGMALRIQAARAALRRYIAQITRAQEDERRRIARDLHDETIQELIALDQRIQMLGLDLQAKGAPEAERAEAIHHAATEAISGIRRLTQALRPIYLEDLGLMPALRMQASAAQETLGIPVTLQRTGAERRLDPNHELAVFRIVQEALANVGRHARAGRVRIELEYGEQSMACRVMDDGIGFRASAHNVELAEQGHFGLIGMRERADLASATLKIVSAPGAGATVEVLVPYSSGTDPQRPPGA